MDICCELKGLEDAEKENGWPQRAGKVVLQIALTRLARHYGLLTTAAGRRLGVQCGIGEARIFGRRWMRGASAQTRRKARNLM